MMKIFGKRNEIKLPLEFLYFNDQSTFHKREKFLKFKSNFPLQLSTKRLPDTNKMRTKQGDAYRV